MNQPDKQNDFISERLLAFLQDKEKEQHTPQKEEVWQHIIRHRRQAKIRRISIWSAVAAILSGVIFLLPTLKKSDTGIMDYVVSLQQEEINISDHIQLITSSGASIALKKESKNLAYDHKGLAYIDSEQLNAEETTDVAIKESNESAEAIKYNRLLVPLGKHIRLTLSDGSVLDVNSGSKVVYPITFSKEKREIFVDGEIFIDVKSTKEKVPFIVHTSRCDVRVLGTAFNVRNYDSDLQTEIVLQRGLVEVADKAKHVIRMIPNERTVLLSGQYKTKSTVDVDKYIIWRKGILLFEGETVGMATQRLHRFYGQPFYCSPEVQDIRLFGKLDINEPLEDVLAGISSAAGLRCEKKENGYNFVKAP